MPAFIQSIGTAVPQYRIPQNTIVSFMQQALNLDDKAFRNLKILYRASGIDFRHSVIPDFLYHDMPGKIFNHTNHEPDLKQRMEIYEQEAIGLASDAISDCVNTDQLHRITHLITVSCTGMYAPGLDIDIIKAFNLPTSIKRTAVNFMGCYGAFNGLKLASSICESDPDASVLVVSVELCTIHFQRRKDQNTTLSQALFSDGAAAALVTSDEKSASLNMVNFHCNMNFSGHKDMSWKIGTNAFDMVLSHEVADIIRKGIHQLTHELLEELPYQKPDITHYAIHPGGKRILMEIEEAMGLSKEHNQHAYEVLRKYGNMSSATVLFVIKEMLDDLKKEQGNQPILSMAFGPGLTLESMLLKLVA